MTSSETANYVYAAPNGSAGSPSFRKLVAADIPSLAAGKITSGTLGAARLPISTTQTNSTTQVPSSSLVYSMNQKISELDNAINQGGDTGMFLTINSATTTFDFTPSAIILLSGSEFDLKLTGISDAYYSMEYYKLMTNVIISSGGYIQYLPTNGTASPDSIFCHSMSYPHSDLTMPSAQATHHLKTQGSRYGYFVLQYKLSLSNNTFSIWTDCKNYDGYTGTNIPSINRVNLMAIVLK